MQRWPTVLAFAFQALAVSEVAAETVIGTLTYWDNEKGALPIAEAQLELWRYSPGFPFGAWTWGHYQDLETDSNGSFSIDIPFVHPDVQYGLRVYASNRYGTVGNFNTPPWPQRDFWTEPGRPDFNYNPQVGSEGAVIDFTFTFTDPGIAAYFNAADVLRLAGSYASALRSPDPDPQIAPADLTVLQDHIGADPGLLFPAGFTPYIILDADNLTDDFTVAHEYAHYLQVTLGSMPWIISEHNGCASKTPAGILTGTVTNSPEHAWLEGFADYFAAVVVNRNSSILTWEDETGHALQIESVSNCSNDPDAAQIRTGQGNIELHVAAALWDLHDPNTSSEPYDNEQDRDGEIFYIMEVDLGTWGNEPTIFQFRDAWIGHGLDVGRLDEILIGNLVIDAPPAPAPARPPPNPYASCMAGCLQDYQRCIPSILQPEDTMEPCEAAHQECTLNCQPPD